MKSFYDHHGMEEADAYDELGGDVVSPGQHAPIAKCRRCGSRDVRWRQQGGRWVLFSLTPGVVHACPVSTSGFEAVPDA